MPGPAVYVVVGVVGFIGVVAVGFAFKELVYDPYLKPQFEQWREEQRARREAKRRSQQPVSPHAFHEAPTGTDETASTHEMEDLGSSATDADILRRSLPINTSTGLRNRRRNPDASNGDDTVVSGSGFMDLPNDDSIPITPLAPEPNPWTSVQAPRSPILTPTRSPFSVGSESPMTLSSPTSGVVSLDASQPRLSPEAPQVQLPTPSESEDEMGAPSRGAPPPLQGVGNETFVLADSHLSTSSATFASQVPTQEMQSFQSLFDTSAPQPSTISRPNLSTVCSGPGNVGESNVSEVPPLVPPSTFEPLATVQPPQDENGILSLPVSPFSESFSLVSGGESGEDDDAIHSDSFRSFSEFGSESHLRLESVRDEVEEDSLTFVSAVSGQEPAVGDEVLGHEDEVEDEGDDDADRRTFVTHDISNSDSGRMGVPDRTIDTILEDLSPSEYDSFSDSDSSIGGDNDVGSTSGGGDEEDNPQTSSSSSASSSSGGWDEVEADYLDLDLGDGLSGYQTPRSNPFSPFD